LNGADMQSAWQLAVKGPLALRCWDGDYVVYNSLSGDTHILDIVTGEVLRQFAIGPATSIDLCRLVAAFLEIPDTGSVAEQVAQIVRALDDLGLIEPVAAC
jgi:PqqD family protein of HPr-rel-A system